MYLLGECFQSTAVEMYSPLVCSVLHAAVWWRRPYLNCTCTWGSWLYFSLHYKVLPAMFQAVHVRLMNNMFVYLISHRTTLTSLDITSLLSPTSRKEARLRHLSMPTEMDARRSHHYYGFSDTLNNYLCSLCCGLVWSLSRLPSMSFYSKAVGGNEALC